MRHARAASQASRKQQSFTRSPNDRRRAECRFLSLSQPHRENHFYLAHPELQRPDPEDASETAHWSAFAYEQNLNLIQIWSRVFESELGSIPDELVSPCCGQFVVSRAAIQRHPRLFYQVGQGTWSGRAAGRRSARETRKRRCAAQEALHWLQHSHLDDFWSGLIFEHTWSYLFSGEANYTHPPVCSFHACDPQAHPATIPWKALVDPSYPTY